MALPRILAVLAAACLVYTAGAQTDPATFTTIVEQPRHGGARRISANSEVDDQSTVRIAFDTTHMTPPAPLVPGGPARPQVQIRVEAYAIKGASRSPIAPLLHYVDLIPAPPPASASGSQTETVSAGTIVYHDKFFDPAIGAAVMRNTELN